MALVHIPRPNEIKFSVLLYTDTLVINCSSWWVFSFSGKTAATGHRDHGGRWWWVYIGDSYVVMARTSCFRSLSRLSLCL